MQKIIQKLSSILLALLIIGCDRKTDDYDSLADLQNAGMIEKGWFPDILPDSVTNISITTHIDIGQCRGKFDLPEKDILNLKQRLTPVPLPFQYDAWRDEIKQLESMGKSIFYYQTKRVTHAFACDTEKEACQFFCG